MKILNKKYSILFAATLTLTSGCAPKVDGESRVAFEESIDTITAEMDEDQKRIFGQNLALASPTLQKMKGDERVTAMLNTGVMADIFRKDLNGMTQSEIESIAQKKRDELTQAINKFKEEQIADIEKKISERQKIESEIRKIEFNVLPPTIAPEDPDGGVGYWIFPVVINNKSNLTFNHIRLEIDRESPTSSSYVESSVDQPVKPKSIITMQFNAYYQKTSAEYPPKLTPDADIPQPTLLLDNPVVTIVAGAKPDNYSRDQSRAIDNLNNQKRDILKRLESGILH